MAKNACIPTPSQMVTKKKHALNSNEKCMLTYAKSNGNEKKHVFLRQIKWDQKKACIPTATVTLRQL